MFATVKDHWRQAIKYASRCMQTKRKISDSREMALKGVKVIELGGLAPGPFCGLVMSDFGAKVIRVDRAGGFVPADSLCRGKRSVAIDLKQDEGRAVFRKLCSNADVLIEPFRKGVMEKLGLGPDVLMADNPRLIYARMTGYGQIGALAERAGHDINYIAISGLLSMLGRKGENPYAPINLMGDFAGGGLICALGIVLGLFERTHSDRGQVIDANMVEGANYVGSFMWTTRNLPKVWLGQRGENKLDSGAPFYQTYKTADNKYMAVGANEPRFYDVLIKGLGLTIDEAPQLENWIQHKAHFAEIFASKTQAEWCEVFDDVDACVTPIIPWDEAHQYKHNADKRSFLLEKSTGLMSPVPAPRMSRTPADVRAETHVPPGQHTVEILKAAGYSDKDIDRMLDSGVIEKSVS